MEAKRVKTYLEFDGQGDPELVDEKIRGFIYEVKAVKDYEKAAINWDALDQNEIIGKRGKGSNPSRVEMSKFALLASGGTPQPE